LEVGKQKTDLLGEIRTLNVGDKVSIKVEGQEIEAILTNLNYKHSKDGKVWILFKTFIDKKGKRNAGIVKTKYWYNKIHVISPKAYIVKPRPDIGPCDYECTFI